MRGMVKIGNLEINGEVYRPLVLQVIESDGRGARTFRRLHEDESVKVEDGMSFWVVFAKDEMLKERPS